ncbi:hypothetical protein LINPERHAP1_LOCUS30575, partial [Linum perenne]
ITLNSDGAVKTNFGKASARGVLRDDLSQILKAYAINLSVCSITRSKHRGALAGLNLAWSMILDGFYCRWTQLRLLPSSKNKKLLFISTL